MLTSGQVVYFAFIVQWILYNENVVVILFVPNGLINKSPLVEMKTLQQTIIWTKDGPSVMHVTCGPFY